jgi:cell division protein FtsB
MVELTAAGFPRGPLGRVLRFFSPGRIILVAVIVAAVYLTFSAGTNLLHSYELVNDESKLRDEVAALDVKEDQLQQIRDYLRTDEYVEFMARRVLGLVKPGETLVIVDAPQSPEASESDPTSLTWWQRLFSE